MRVSSSVERDQEETLFGSSLAISVTIIDI